MARRDTSKENFWRGVLDEHARSGMNIREFCRKKNIKEALFYAWRRQIRFRDAESPPMTGLCIMRDAVEYYRRKLYSNRTAQEHLKKRGLFSPELVDSFRIGYCDGSIGKLLRGPMHETAVEEGILHEDGTEHLQGCIVLPLEDSTGAIVNLAGWEVKPATRDGAGELRHVKDPDIGMLNSSALRTCEKIILAQTLPGCLRLHALGFTDAVFADHKAGISRVLADRSNGLRELTILRESDDGSYDRLVKEAVGCGMKIAATDAPEAEGNGPYPEAAWTRESISEALGKKQVLAEEAPSGEDASEDPDELLLERAGIVYRARGLESVTPTCMRVLVEARAGGRRSTDRLDLYVSRNRKRFAGAVARAFGKQQAKIEEQLKELMAAIEKRLRDRDGQEPESHELTAKERREATAFLETPELLENVDSLLERMGYVGEEANRKLAYLVAVSCMLDSPLSLLIRSNSSAGKSELLEKVVALMPKEDVFFLSRISPQALYYMPEDALSHKLVIVDERHGAQEAEYSIRSLQSRKKLTMAVVMKDPATGKSRTTVFQVQGPIAYMDSSTTLRDNPENENRCFVAYLDETKEQTRRVIKRQNASKTLEGRKALEELEEAIGIAVNAVRILEPVKVTIPFLDRVTFPPEYLRARRDNLRFLNLIEAIAFLYQHQREKKEDPVLGLYVEATPEDYRKAYELVRASAGSAYSDVPRVARTVLEGIRSRIEALSSEEGIDPQRYEFTRRMVRGWLRISDDQAKRALRTLVDLEYLYSTARGRGGKLMYRLGDVETEQEIVGKLTRPEKIDG